MKQPARAAAFWEVKSLTQMDQAEWESLCDGCGRCCLNKYEDIDGEVYYSRAACTLLDIHSCRCTDYGNRLQRVPDCLPLSPDNVKQYSWLPSTCAYRRLAEGKPLPAWHPLVSGDPHSVHQAGISIRHFAVGEHDLAHPEDHPIDLYVPDDD